MGDSALLYDQSIREHLQSFANYETRMSSIRKVGKVCCIGVGWGALGWGWGGMAYRGVAWRQFIVNINQMVCAGHSLEKGRSLERS